MSTTRATSALLALCALAACPAPGPEQSSPQSDDHHETTKASAAPAPETARPEVSAPEPSSGVPPGPEPAPAPRAALEPRREVALASGQAALDRRAVSGLEFSRCVDAGICARPSYDRFNREPDYKDEPAMSVDWYMARSYCDFVGKRLPTLEEYQQVWRQLTWKGCCARNVIPREWAADEPDTPTATQVRLRRGKFQVLDVSKRKAVDSSTVRCARDLDPGAP